MEELKLIILDVNDNAPYFTECSNFNLSESTKTGQFVSKVYAKDKDFKQAEITYSYSKDQKVCFAVFYKSCVLNLKVKTVKTLLLNTLIFQVQVLRC